MDIVNLLVGPLAEAKYVALRDEEAINRNLINLNSLKFYGGASDLEILDDYIDCFVENLQQGKESIERFFIDAFTFIDCPLHWVMINKLAKHILHASETVISWEDIVDILSIDCFKKITR